MIQKRDIDAFLATPRIAVLGVNRDSRALGSQLFEALRARGCDVVAVNPRMEGSDVYRDVRDVQPAPGAAVLVLPPGAHQAAVKACDEAGIRSVWFQGRPDPEALRVAQTRGLSVIHGYCPFLFLKEAGFPHTFHRGVLHLLKRLPK